MIAVSAPHKSDGHVHETHGHKTATDEQGHGHTHTQKAGIYSVCISWLQLFLYIGVHAYQKQQKWMRMFAAYINEHYCISLPDA